MPNRQFISHQHSFVTNIAFCMKKKETLDELSQCFDFCLTNLFGRHQPLKGKQCIVIRFSEAGKHIAQINLFSSFLLVCFDINFNPYTYVLYQDRDKVCIKQGFLVDCVFQTTDEHVADEDEIGLNPRPNAHTIRIINRHTKIKINNKR